jgi:outer membrane biosynthesis protein TonB
MENVATYSEARSEYTKQLATFVVPPVVGWFQKLWVQCAVDRQRSLSTFQTECEEVARWNQDRITDEVRALLERSGCDYMEELMTAVFIAHTKVLTAVRLTTKQKKLSITVPKLDHFIHRVFRESARSFWKSPFLFMTDSGVVERQKNLLQIEGLAIEAITTAVRGLLPVKQILADYLGEDEEIVEAPVEEAPVVEAPVDPDVKEITTGPKVEAEAEPKVEPKVEAEPVPKPEAQPVINIDTEPSVRFSNTLSVFDETTEPELMETPEDDGLKVDEASTKPLDLDDMEDLEKPVSAPAYTDDEIVVLE